MTEIYLTISLSTHSGDDTPQNDGLFVFIELQQGTFN